MDSASAHTSFLQDPVTFAKRNALAPGEDANIDSNLKPSRPVGPQFESVSPMSVYRQQRQLGKTKIPEFMTGMSVVKDRFRSKDQMPAAEYEDTYQRSWAKLEKIRPQGNLQCGMYAIDMLPAVLATPTKIADRFPCWFLPWNPGGGLTHMSIPRTTYLHTKAATHRPTSASAADPTWGDFVDNPPYFFTTALSGCSVFITGSAETPTIYHAGKGSSAFDYTSGAAQKMDLRTHWKDCFRDADPTAFAQKAYSEVDKDHYSGPTQRVQAYQATLAAYDIQNILSVGTVFGVRTGRSWDFYLQEIARITYRRASDKQIRTVHRPIALTKIFPGAVGSIVLQDQTQVVKAIKN